MRHRLAILETLLQLRIRKRLGHWDDGLPHERTLHSATTCYAALLLHLPFSGYQRFPSGSKAVTGQRWPSAVIWSNLSGCKLDLRNPTLTQTDNASRLCLIQVARSHSWISSNRRPTPSSHPPQTVSRPCATSASACVLHYVRPRLPASTWQAGRWMPQHMKNYPPKWRHQVSSLVKFNPAKPCTMTPSRQVFASSSMIFVLKWLLIKTTCPECTILCCLIRRVWIAYLIRRVWNDD